MTTVIGGGMMRPEEVDVLRAAIAWHEARYPDLNMDTAFDTSDRLHEAVERLPKQLPRIVYRCSVCEWTDDAHRFAPCDGGEWVQDTSVA